VTILAFFFNEVSNIVILILLVSIPAELYIVLKTRKSIKTGNIILLVFGLFIGIIFGNKLLLSESKINLFMFMGLVISVFSLYFIFLEDRLKPRRINKFWTFLIGILSGITSTAFGMGGPPIILYYRFLNPPKAEFRVNLLTIFFITSCIKTPLYIYNGLLNPDHLVSALIVLPFVILGIWVGYYLHLNIDENRFKKYTALAMLILGLMLMLE